MEKTLWFLNWDPRFGCRYAFAKAFNRLKDLKQHMKELEGSYSFRYYRVVRRKNGVDMVYETGEYNQ